MEAGFVMLLFSIGAVRSCSKNISSSGGRKSLISNAITDTTYTYEYGRETSCSSTTPS